LISVSNCGTLQNIYAPRDGLAGSDHGPALLFSSVASSNFVPKDGNIGTKRGEACQSSALMLFSWGDSSLPEAMKVGGIKVLKHYGIRSTRLTPLIVFPVYSSDCLIVFGD
jgi:TRL-like protein family